MAREARCKHIALRRERVGHILQSTQDAADAHMPHKVYQLVSQLKPWNPLPRPRLKSQKGELLTAAGEYKRLLTYCQEIFSPKIPIPETGPPKLLMTAATWTKYLGQTKIGKAVPQGCAPAAAWKVCSDMLGPYLESISLAVEEEGVLPSEWCSPELIWLTKPNKAPDTPEHLRPIGLLSPTAKAAAASVRELLMPGIQRLLTAVPQFAYLANRDIYDALARVNGQLASIKHSLALTVSNRFVQRQRREEATGTGRWLQPISGGAVLSVDLHKAFDLLTREQLQSTLSKIVADEGVKQTALLLHTKCQYLLFQEGKATAVDTTRGVRQGCRLAPALWSAVSGDLLHHMVQDPFTGPMTIFADDHLGAWTFHTQDDILAMERDVLKLFQVLSEAGMSVNPSKSKLIVKVKGAEAERYMAKRTAHIRGQPHWCFGEGSDRVEVPIVQEFVYLGTVVTLSRQSDRTVSHRLEEARKREGQLRKCIRSRSVLRAGTRVAIWRACVVASAMYGLLAQELTATNVTTIRQWYHKSLRAVTGMPVHITHVSNADLRTKFGLQEPLEALLQLTRSKLRRLSGLQAGHAATLPATMEHWKNCERNLAILVQTDNLALTPLTADVPGVPCPYCGIYFQHTKAMRQHTARKHGVKWREPMHIAYDPSLHAKDGMPECRHCGKRCGSHQGLKFHITHNACGWHPLTPGEVIPQPPDAFPSAIAPPEQPATSTRTSTPAMHAVPTSNEAVQGGNSNQGTPSEVHNAVVNSQVNPMTAQETHPSREEGHSPPKQTRPNTHSTEGAEQDVAGDPEKQYLHPSTQAAHRGRNQGGDDEQRVPVASQIDLAGTAPQHSSVWAYIRSDTSPDALQINNSTTKWKDRLAQHCCICNNWALDKSSVKCHLIRMHAQEWYRVAEAVADACKAHKHLFVRDTECQLCLKKVYGVERHALQCPVLFQASFMSCLAKAPSAAPDIWHRLIELTTETCQSYLQGSLQITQDIAESLNRFCILCARQNTEASVMDIQAWRKHLQQVHGVHKTVLTTRFHEQAALVSMKRPCVFCRMPFQKSPNLHRSKCLPLAQLLSVQHGYAGVGGDANCGSVGAVLSDGVNGGIHTRSSTGSQGERGEDEASQVPKAGEGRRKGPDRGAQTPGASRGRRGRRTDPSVSVRDQDHPNSTSAARPSAQSAGSGQDVRALLLDHGHVDFGHAEDSDQPLEGTIHARLMRDHTQGSPAHESMVGNGGKAHQVRTGRSGNQGDGGERPFPGSTKSLGLHSVEPAGEEGTGHGSTASVIGRAEGGDQDAQGSSHDGGGHPQVCPDAEAGGKHHSSGSGLHAGADDKACILPA